MTDENFTPHIPLSPSEHRQHLTPLEKTKVGAGLVILAAGQIAIANADSIFTTEGFVETALVDAIALPTALAFVLSVPEMRRRMGQIGHKLANLGRNVMLHVRHSSEDHRQQG